MTDNDRSSFPDSTIIANKPSTIPVRRVIKWVAIGFGTLALTAIITYKSYYALLPLEPTVIGALGTALGFGGLVGTLVGFGLTIWQLVQTSASAEAANQAVRNVKKDYGSFDVIAELVTARSVNDKVRASLKAKDAESATFHYDKLRESVMRIASSSVSKGNELGVYFKDAASEIIVAVGILREFQNDIDVPWNKLIADLERLDNSLISTNHMLRENARAE